MHIFWIAGLLLALIDFPDLSGLLKRIARSTEKIAAKNSAEGADQSTPSVVTVSENAKIHHDRDEAGRGRVRSANALVHDCPKRSRGSAQESDRRLARLSVAPTRLDTIYYNRFFSELGGLISYHFSKSAGTAAASFL
jgi:hypothetical protein